MIDRLRRHPLHISAAVLALFIIFPAIDITVSSWFFDPSHQVFVLRVHPVGEWVRKSMPYAVFGLAGYVAVLWGVGELLGQAVMGISRKVGFFLLSSLALGPGLLVNLILKDSWGRPRPSTIHQFGGPDCFVPPMVVTNQCDYNCSFPSGHASLAFWLVAFALLVPRAWRRLAVTVATVAGFTVGCIRVAQGGHFLSDIVFSGVVTITVIFLLHRRIFDRTPPWLEKNLHQ